jgi:hypothetical protein
LQLSINNEKWQNSLIQFREPKKLCMPYTIHKKITLHWYGKKKIQRFHIKTCCTPKVMLQCSIFRRRWCTTAAYRFSNVCNIQHFWVLPRNFVQRAHKNHGVSTQKTLRKSLSNYATLGLKKYFRKMENNKMNLNFVKIWWIYSGTLVKPNQTHAPSHSRMCLHKDLKQLLNL